MHVDTAPAPEGEEHEAAGKSSPPSEQIRNDIATEANFAGTSLHAVTRCLPLLILRNPPHLTN